MENKHMIQTKDIVQALLKNKILNSRQIEEAQASARLKNLELGQYIIEANLVKEEDLYQALASFFNTPFIDLKDKKVRKDILQLIPQNIAENQKIVVFDKVENNLLVATLDPQNLELLELLRKKTGFNLKVYLTTPSAIKNILNQYRSEIKTELKEALKKPETTTTKELKQLAADLPVIRIVDTILEYAIAENASDIHLEPTEKEVLVRFRIDGVLREVMTLPKKIHSGVVARIKVLSNLKLDEHRLPQDGRFKITTDEYKVSFRVSIYPVYDGEKIVLRLLNESARLLNLEQLGLLPRALSIVKRNIKKPHGMILVTGPTGSGKTTTLYTILNVLNTPHVNISTIEDPIEYRMPGINQSQVNPKIGFTFARGLRSLLRQDPDIIMVGEIRDQETAEIALHAALTGHLVLSTLHTNDAVTTLPRLAEMGIPNFLIASTTNIVIAQRLVRRICMNCITSYNLTRKSIEEIEKMVNVQTILETLERERMIKSAKTPLEELLFFRGKGCKKCNFEGYKGRIGIYEVLEITPPIREIILKGGTAEDLAEEAKKQKMITMLEDGFIKAKSGITSIEEVLRVSKE